jgi:antitoxin VapB
LTERDYNFYFTHILFEVAKMKTAKLFQNGQSQAVRLPKEFRFDGDEVFIKKSGSAVVLIPLVNSWDSLIGSLDKFTKDYMAGGRRLGTRHRLEIQGMVPPEMIEVQSGACVGADDSVRLEDRYGRG